MGFEPAASNQRPVRVARDRTRKGLTDPAARVLVFRGQPEGLAGRQARTSETE